MASVIAGMLLAGVVATIWWAVWAIHANADIEAAREKERESRDREVSLRYAIDMQSVQQRIWSGLSDEVWKLLNAHLPQPNERDRRGFEWFYYDHLAKSQRKEVLLKQSNPFTGLAAAQDGRMVALIDPEEIKAFDLSRGKVVQRWPRMHRRYEGTSISSDGQWIALGTTNRSRNA